MTPKQLRASRPRAGTTYYFAANQHEGCGHKHATVRAARKCLPRIDREHGRPAIYEAPQGMLPAKRL